MPASQAFKFKMPLSPLPDAYEHGIHHLVQHNSNTSYPQEHYDEGVHLQSAYSSPTPTQDGYSYRAQQPRYTYQHQHHDSGMGMQYDGYNPDYQSSSYQDHYSTPATSPPTPSMNSHDTLRTRSGLGIPRAHQALRPMPEGGSRCEKSPKPKKVKKEKAKAEKKVAKLDEPLSVLTKDWTHVPIVDIEAYVNRSAEVRRKEVEEGKVPGKVKRPMNSFMLYRKAYQNRTREWSLQNNHQVVSQVCGDSWPLEPEEIKEQFSEWARIERINHQNAHPGYKFSPTKPGTAKPSKRKASEEPETEESDLDDFDWQAGSSRRPQKKPRPAPRVEQQPIAYPTTRSAYHYSSRENSIEPAHGGYNRSSYQATNPGRSLPPQYQTSLQNGEYYQQSIVPHHLPRTEDVILKKTSAPGVHSGAHSGAHSYLGLPGGQDYDLMNQYPQSTPPVPEPRIDPSLIAQDHTIYNDSNYGDPSSLYFDEHQNGDRSWQPQYGLHSEEGHDPLMPYLESEHRSEGLEIQDPHMHVLKGHHEGWKMESLDTGGEFDNNWLGDE